jgi:hypothetical protein
MIPSKDIDRTMTALLLAKAIVGDTSYVDNGNGATIETDEGSVIISTNGEVVFKPIKKQIKKGFTEEPMSRVGRVFNGPKTGVCPACGK